MNIPIALYRARIGAFNNRSYQFKLSKSVDISSVFTVLRILSICTLLAMIVTICGDVEIQPGPLDTSIDDNSSSSYESVTCSDIDDSTFTKGIKTFLSLLHLNIQSIIPKLDIINGSLFDFDILCFTESWLNNSIPDNDVLLDGYQNPFRCDRVNRMGGGVKVYCKNNLLCTRRRDLEINGLENVWVEVSSNDDKFLIGTFYRPPNSDGNV